LTANPRTRWLIMAVAVIGSFMSVLDSTIVNIALATLGDAFHESVNTIQWVVTAYLLALGVSIPIAGYLADRFGPRRVFTASLAAFTAGSFLCGIAPNLQVLIVFRVVQGLGGGSLLPLAMAMVFNAFPAGERGKAMGMMGVPTLLAPAIGPTLGGWLVEDVSWRWIFYVNIPIGIAAVALALLWLPKDNPQHPAGNRKFDVTGILLSALGTSLVLYSVSEIPDKGWDSSVVLITGALGLIALLAFGWVELHVADPVLDIRLFRSAAFFSANVANCLLSASLFTGTFLVPLFLQGVAGKSPIEAGFAIVPRALAAAAFMPVGGRLYDRFGVKLPTALGLAILLPASLALVTINVDYAGWWLATILIFIGIGLGLSAMPLSAACLAAAGPAAGARASSLVNVTRQLVASMGVAVVATFLASRITAHSGAATSPLDAALFGYHDAFVLSALLGLPALVAVFLIVVPDAPPVVQDADSERLTFVEV
jgi:EmrB/QacA subfamily drug resistance transporter